MPVQGEGVLLAEEVEGAEGHSAGLYRSASLSLSLYLSRELLALASAAVAPLALAPVPAPPLALVPVLAASPATQVNLYLPLYLQHHQIR